MANRVTKPTGIGIYRMRTSVGRYDAEGSRILMKERNVVRALKNLELVRHAPRLGWHQRHAVRGRSRIIHRARDSKFFRAGLQYRACRSGRTGPASPSATCSPAIDTGQ